MHWTHKTSARMVRLNLTFTDLERESGINRQTLVNWRDGASKRPNAVLWEKLEDTLRRLERQAERKRT